MIKENIIEKIKAPGRGVEKKILKEIQKNLNLYRNELLNILNREAESPQNPASRMEYNDWIYAMYLLAEVREKDAYANVIKLFSRPGNFLNPLTGDIVLQNLGQIFASLSNGDISLIKELIETESANEYCRGAGIEALVILVEIGEVSREDLYHYFKDLFKKIDRIPIFLWTILAQCSIYLYKKSYLKEVKQAFNNKLIDEIYLDLEEIESYISNEENSSLALLTEKYKIIIDSVSAMEWWANFKE